MGVSQLFSEKSLEDTSTKADLSSNNANDSSERKPDLLLSSSPSEVSLFLLDECFVLYRFAMERGLDIAPELSESLFCIAQEIDLSPNALSQGVMAELGQIHKSLCSTITPATPKSARYLFKQQQQRSRFQGLGNIPLVRQFSALTIILLGSLCAIGMQPEVNAESIELGILHSNGFSLLLNMLFVLVCAGLGSCFSTLFRVNGYVAKGSFDPSYSTTYWSRLVLGMMSGIIIVELLPSSLFSEGSLGSFGKPTFAMLAGFSADLVYRILEKLVGAVKSVVQGDDESKKEYQAAKSKAEKLQDAQNSKLTAAEKMLTVSQLLQSGQYEAADKEIKTYVSALRSPL